MKNNVDTNNNASGFADQGPVGVILSSDEGAAGKTTTALQLVTAFDTKQKLAMKAGVSVQGLLVPERRNSRGDDLVPSDVVAPWYRAVTAKSVLSSSLRATMLSRAALMPLTKGVGEELAKRVSAGAAAWANRDAAYLEWRMVISSKSSAPPRFRVWQTALR